MKLDVIDPEKSPEPWYVNGLNFTCTQCGNCCTGGPGYVWISEDEVGRLAGHLNLSEAETLQTYCRKVGGRISLKERRTPEGLYDCIFLKEQPGVAGEGIACRPKICSVYSVRPLQCRTWPFWPELLADPARWKAAGDRCHGIDQGDRRFTRAQIESIRDAAQWPENPPTSKAEE